MASRFRSFVFSILIYVAFFASGASSLIAEVSWNRMLIVVVGNSLSATALILIIFMGGLGFGSYLGGRIFSHRRASLMPYVMLEVIIGIYVLASPTLVSMLSDFFASAAQSIENGAALTLVRVLVTMVALFIPASLMGATFPAIISGTAQRQSADMTARTGYLYSINTLGAAIGCFAAGYHLLFEFGVPTTLSVAFTMYLAAAGCALIANFLVPRSGEEAVSDAPTVAEETAPVDSNRDRLRRYLYPATFGVGFVSLAYEVLLTRLGILHLGNSVSVFALVLTGFLMGTGISAIVGTWFYGMLRRRSEHADRLYGITALISGLAVLGTPYLLLGDWLFGPEQFARIADSTPHNPLPILLVIIAPTVLVGSLLPVAIRMMQPEGRRATTREAATLYSLNTVGGLLGAGVANHYLVPAVGVQMTLLFLASVCVVIALWQLLSRYEPRRRMTLALGMTLAVAVVLGLTLPNMIHLYAEKIAYSTLARETEVLLVEEGRAATVTVIDQRDPAVGSYRDMYLNGVEEASTRYWHTQLFKLLGIHPVLAHPSDGDKEVLVIAFGAGITAGSVLASDEVTSLDVVDLNPDIEGINDFFTEVNGDVFHQPRFHFYNDDGRGYLVTNHKQYDVIVNDSTHPRAYDSWILYTEEFYELVKQRLKPDGVFAQWVPVLGSMRGDLFRIHLNTFRKVFPHSTFWYVPGSDQAYFLATPGPLQIDPERLQAKLDKLPEWFRAQEYQIDTVARLAGFFWLDEMALERMIAGETRINTDNVHYFDKQSAVYPLPPQWQLPMFQASAMPYVLGADPQLREDIRLEQQVALSLGRYAYYLDRADLYAAFCKSPQNGNARYFIALTNDGKVPDSDDLCRDLMIQDYRKLLAQFPGNFEILNALADLYCQAGRLEEAESMATKALSVAPDHGMVLDTFGWIRYQQGRYPEARVMLERAVDAYPNEPVVLYHLGATQLAMGEEDAGRRNLVRAVESGAEFPGVENARALSAVSR